MKTDPSDLTIFFGEFLIDYSFSGVFEHYSASGEILDGYNGSSTLPPSHHSRLSGANSEEHWDQNFLTARNWNKPRTGRTKVPVLQQAKVH